MKPTHPEPPIHSRQTDVHEQLHDIVTRHLAHPYRKPILAHNRASFDAFEREWQARDTPPLILDSGCGVGESSLHLARAHPDAWVVGVDQSEERLSTRKTWWTGAWPNNVSWYRADLIDFWRLLADALHTHQRQLQRHCIYYPNPWPKVGHVQRRWHGHPVFPSLLALGGELELRSNWDVYVREFAQAVRWAQPQAHINEYQLPDNTADDAVTPFERKYALRGQGLFGVRVQLAERL